MFLCKYVSISSKLTWCVILQTQKILQFIFKNKRFLSKTTLSKIFKHSKIQLYFFETISFQEGVILV